MPGFKFVLILGLILQAGFAFSDDYVICKNKKVVRTLRVVKEKGHCETVYTKDGKDQKIGSGSNLDSCDKYLADVRKTLDSNGWICRDVKRAAVSNLKEKSEP